MNMSDEQIRKRAGDAEDALTDVVEAMIKDASAQEIRGKTMLQLERLRTARFLVTSTLFDFDR